MFKHFNLLNFLIFLILWNLLVGGAINTYFFVDYYQRNYNSWSEFFWACLTIEHYVNYWKFLVSSNFNIILLLLLILPLIGVLLYFAWDWFQENISNKTYHDFETSPPSKPANEQAVKSKTKRRKKKKKK